MSEHIVGVNPKVYNGRKYKSTLEAETAKTLDDLGIPWEYEAITYTLQEGFYCPWQKRKVEDIQYTPDFRIGPIIVETKGYETPDWKIKKKLFFKHLKETAPDTLYYIVKNTRQLLEILDQYWPAFDIQVAVSTRGTKKIPSETKVYNSIKDAMIELQLTGRPMGSILRSLLGKAMWIYGYNWKLIKVQNGN